MNKIKIELEVESLVELSELKETLIQVLSDTLNVDFIDDDLIGDVFKISVKIEAEPCIDHTPIECHCDACIEKYGWNKGIKEYGE